MGIGRTAVALSSDGSLLAYAAERNGKAQLYLRALDHFDASPISGTEGAYSPFFSPDRQAPVTSMLKIIRQLEAGN
ncbi:MAG: hypothetical protein M3410_10320 [Acidobacteriota bacterium]|nr:hypothetical protein [Acidobacteriota bacterium]